MTDPLEPRDLSHHAPATKPLSPAAQAVLDASYEAWITKDDPWSIAATALRAAADQVVPERDCPDTEEWAGQSAWVQAESRARFRLLAIVAELRATMANHSPSTRAIVAAEADRAQRGDQLTSQEH